MCAQYARQQQQQQRPHTSSASSAINRSARSLNTGGGVSRSRSFVRRSCRALEEGTMTCCGLWLGVAAAAPSAGGDVAILPVAIDCVWGVGMCIESSKSVDVVLMFSASHVCSRADDDTYDDSDTSIQSFVTDPHHHHHHHHTFTNTYTRHYSSSSASWWWWWWAGAPPPSSSLTVSGIRMSIDPVSVSVPSSAADCHAGW
jgi:hypothetical protein